jgi:hypothetical protein
VKPQVYLDAFQPTAPTNRREVKTYVPPARHSGHTPSVVAGEAQLRRRLGRGEAQLRGGGEVSPKPPVVAELTAWNGISTIATCTHVGCSRGAPTASSSGARRGHRGRRGGCWAVDLGSSVRSCETTCTHASRAATCILQPLSVVRGEPSRRFRRMEPPQALRASVCAQRGESWYRWSANRSRRWSPWSQVVR